MGASPAQEATRRRLERLSNLSSRLEQAYINRVVNHARGLGGLRDGYTAQRAPLGEGRTTIAYEPRREPSAPSQQQEQARSLVQQRDRGRDRGRER
jgi:hypothetical protein